jgi:hypothetical protein
MRSRLIAIAAAVVVAGLLAGPGGTASAGVDPADFTSPTANPYFPLRPGTAFLYRGTEDQDRLVEHLRITRRKRTIEGVATTVVHDILFANGALAEKTTDWYADDNAGNTWYFGEATATYRPNGQIESSEGSWQAGVHGGIAGIIMPADPRATDAYRQEYRKGHAEDQAWIVQRHASLTVAYGTVDQVVRSFEWTRLEPHVVSVKFYAPGLGIVAERDLVAGTEDMQLVDVRHF